MFFFLNKFKNFLVSLRFAILAIFITLFIVSILLLIFINYFYFSKTFVLTANHLLQEISIALKNDIQDELNRAEKDNMLSAQLIKLNVVSPTDISELTSYTYHLANYFNLTDGAYWSDTNGTLVYSKYENDNSITTEVIDRSRKTPVKYFIYRDTNGNTIKRVDSQDFSYDPRNMPWYEQAKKEQKTVWTDVIPYTEAPYLGVTIATPVYNDNKLIGIFGSDFRLDWLSEYVGTWKISPNAYIFIVTKNGKLIAFPGLYREQGYNKLLDIHAISKPWLVKSFEIFQKQHQENFIFYYNNIAYLASFKTIPQFTPYGWYLVFVVPLDDFIKELKISSFLSFMLGILVLVLGVILISYLVTRLVKPIDQVVKQTEKIKNLELEEDEKIPTHIKEVSSLSNAIQTMKRGLKSFQKYIPATLVRQLIEAGEHAKIGGKKKSLCIFFADIKDFTSLAESVDPQILLEHICEYFEEFSQIILEEKGTIDKYIGDAIMAFWGAPLAVKDPCHAAARAALRCIERLELLNIKWLKEGKTPLVTRIGIHVGEAIVGNVGSKERLNYTAFGDTINVANRLENVNKIYGTHILVSQSVFNIIKDHFILRLIDHVALKGKHKSSFIYELLARKKEKLTFDFDQYTQFFQAGFDYYQKENWDKAMQAFENCLQVYPNDTVAPVFIERCREFKVKTPKDWDGVWKT